MNKHTAQCQFCGRSFSSKQGVRAHLKSCPAYQTAKRTGTNKESANLHKDSYRVPKSSLPKAERGENASAKFSLEIQDKQRRADEERQRRRKERDDYWQHEAEKAERRRCQQMEEDAIREQKEAEDKRVRKKREAIQEVKRKVVDWYFSSYSVPAAAKAQVKMEVERVLATLPIAELPLSELIQIGEGIRDKIYAPYENAITAQNKTSQISQEVLKMSRERLISGIYFCPNCNEEFDLHRENEAGLICEECGGRLEETPEDEEEEY
jgi:DNA-directed RNA polymerase subunit RPC12/RpoP